MLDIARFREIEPVILAIGSNPGILQSIVDFDYLSGKKRPTLLGIVAGGRKYERYFWGDKEILIPVFPSLQDLTKRELEGINLFLNLTSGRRVLTSCRDALESLPNLIGGTVFAENVPEKHALEIYENAKRLEKFVIGPASVGLLIPGKVKLGAIGGTQAEQIVGSKLLGSGNSAVFSASGGMANELINILAQNGKAISFAFSFGGDRFPILTPKEAFLVAQEDTETDNIIYFGELGGYDEYEVAELLEKGKITKNVIAYIGGSISEMFATPPQFGHAKAMAGRPKESAKAKREALRDAGAKVADSFEEFVSLIKNIPSKEKSQKSVTIPLSMSTRKHALFVNRISEEKEDGVEVLGTSLPELAKNNTFSYIVLSLLLGKKIKSKELEEFGDFILKLLVDHGPNVSGAVNTMITARAGKDLVSSLVSGLLTIGPRFGGAINAAAKNWLTGASSNKEASNFVEDFAQKGEYVPGIGHRKYTTDNPDMRVEEILKFAAGLEGKYTKFAKNVEKITTSKKGNLILNVDGAIACVMLDLLTEKENLPEKELKELVDVEFFNAFFVLSRSVGFTAYYLDQRRIDEGLFRLPADEVRTIASKDDDES
ncbi:MAG: citrate/2-methylcitrate synthase [bacterium]|nr:citrate/2-methylcitrate synthase [bacterium]